MSFERKPHVAQRVLRELHGTEAVNFDIAFTLRKFYRRASLKRSGNFKHGLRE
mgnify:CR=1 FL=1